MWLHSDQEDLLGMNVNVNVNDASSMFYVDFPLLPNFQCMSSSSSSSSTPAPVKAIACSSSSSSSASSFALPSSAVLKSDGEEDIEKMKTHCFYNKQQHGCVDAIVLENGDGGGDGDVGNCMDVMDSFGYIEFLENNNDFASIFQNNENPLVEFTQEQERKPCHEQEFINMSNNEDEGTDGEMSMVFLEWLKSNKDCVSANDLRSVKLKKATIECAAKRLGGGKEGMKRLLKLILEWVQTSHLRSKKCKENHNNNTITTNNNTASNVVTQFQNHSHSQNQNTNPSSF